MIFNYPLPILWIKILYILISNQSIIRKFIKHISTSVLSQNNSVEKFYMRDESYERYTIRFICTEMEKWTLNVKSWWNLDIRSYVDQIYQILTNPDENVDTDNCLQTVKESIADIFWNYAIQILILSSWKYQVEYQMIDKSDTWSTICSNWWQMLWNLMKKYLSHTDC